MSFQLKFKKDNYQLEFLRVSQIKAYTVSFCRFFSPNKNKYFTVNLTYLFLRLTLLITNMDTPQKYTLVLIMLGANTINKIYNLTK